MIKFRRERIDLSPTPGALLLAYRAWIVATGTLDEGRLGNLGRVHHNEARRQRGYDRAARRAADLAYGTGRVDKHDRIVGVPREQGDLAEITLLVDGGGALDVALAIITHDLLTADEFETLTRWWQLAWGPMPTIEAPPTPAAVPLADTLAEAIPPRPPARPRAAQVAPPTRPTGPPPDWPPTNAPRNTAPPRPVANGQRRSSERLTAEQHAAVRAARARLRILARARLTAYTLAALTFAVTFLLLGLGAYSWALASMFAMGTTLVAGAILGRMSAKNRMIHF
jgi:hypothetical protein